MKQLECEQLQAMATRLLLTCKCTHDQTDHMHELKEMSKVGRWLRCMRQGCMCKAFVSQITAREKANMDRLLDAKVAAGKLAAILQNQPAPPFQRVSQAPIMGKPVKGKHRVRSARSSEGAAVSPLYHELPTKKPKDKYAWEE